MPLVVLEYADLLSEDKDLSGDILRAYGEGSVGALGVRGIPNWQDMCVKTLPLAHKLVSLPDEKLSALEDETSMYNAGWSFGKEKMGDTPDYAKGSFYYNPLTDDPCPELRERFPASVPANKWPREEDIPNFKGNCCELGTVMRDVAVLLARHIDKLLAKQVAGYEKGTFYDAMYGSTKAKARMLYYFPLKSQSEGAGDTAPAPGGSWIAWHNDSGFLTCLASELFIEHSTGRIVDNPEPETAGLFIADRDGVEHKISIPPDCMGIQIGECLQIVSGGLLVATPHCVRGCKRAPDIARLSLPCFVDTTVTFPLSTPSGCSRGDVFRHTVAQKVPPLSERWTRDGETFAEFLECSFRSYYDWIVGDKKI
ncbi:unnamed protein product [Ectocarpus fasciculatus]